jgi:hypothetical protein
MIRRQNKHKNESETSIIIDELDNDDNIWNDVIMSYTNEPFAYSI